MAAIFSNENIEVLIKIAVKFVPNGPINNISAFLFRPGKNPLSEPMMLSL